MDLTEAFLKVVDHLWSKGEMMKAYIVCCNAPSYIEEQEEVIRLKVSLKKRLKEISEMQNHGTQNGKFNAGFNDPQNPEGIVKYQMLKDFVKLRGLKTLVDVGCFSGWIGRNLSLEGIKVHGIDIHPVIMQISAFAATGTKATFEFLPVQQLGLTHPYEYDGVILFDILEHCFDVDVVIASCEKALMSGGYMIINLPHVEGEQVAKLHPLQEHEHLYSFSPTKVKELFGHKKNVDIQEVINEQGVVNWWITYAV